MVLQTIRLKKSKEFGEMTGFIERAYNRYKKMDVQCTHIKVLKEGKGLIKVILSDQSLI